MRDPKHVESAYWNKIRKAYGVHKKFVLDTIKSQGGKCAICGNPFPEFRRPDVDHCHATGRFRGVLCGRCNMAIGLFDEDPERLARAIEYLIRPLPEVPKKSLRRRS